MGFKTLVQKKSRRPGTSRDYIPAIACALLTIALQMKSIVFCVSLTGFESSRNILSTPCSCKVENAAMAFMLATSVPSRTNDLVPRTESIHVKRSCSAFCLISFVSNFVVNLTIFVHASVRFLFFVGVAGVILKLSFR